MHRSVRRLTVPILALALAIASSPTPSFADLGVSPSSLSADLFTGQSAEQTLTLSNSGVAPISYALRIQAANPGSALAQRRALRRSRVAALPPRVAARAVVSPESAPKPAPWQKGTPALRPMLPPSLTAPGVLEADLRALVLTSGAGVIEIQAVLAGLPDIGQVDIFDGQAATPTAVDLAPYDFVLVSVNFPFLDPAATGDALADYVDAGGSVILTLASFVTNWEVGGRFMTGGYHPLTAAGGPIGGSTLGSFDPLHPIMAGVSAIAGSLLADASLTPGSEVVASWGNGEPFVATRGRSVIALNLYVADAGFWTGDVPTLLHNAALWTALAAPWLTAAPDSGVVLPGGESTATVRFDATGLPGGGYDAEIVVDAIDPAVTDVVVPAHLQVTGAPDLLFEGVLNASESSADFSFEGATTQHALAAGLPPGGDGTLEVQTDGDFGSSFETASVTVEGEFLGMVGATGNDCVPVSTRFVLPAARLAGWAADGVVQVAVQNSFDVNPFCVVNRHTVRLRYHGPTASLDFGTTFVGGCDSLVLSVTNRGSEPLAMQLNTGLPFVAPGSLAVAPHETQDLVLGFCPSAVGLFEGTLNLVTNDPDQPEIVVALRGTGEVPPDIDLSPTELSADLLTGATAQRTLTVRNTGGAALDFAIGVAITPPPAPAPRAALAAPSSAVAAAFASGHSDRVPQGWKSIPPSRVGGTPAKVLLIQDFLPWGTQSNEQVLMSNGIAYNSIPTSQIAVTDLTAYRLVIVASDQPTFSYITLTSRFDQLTDYVNQGGVLEVHAAGWGFSGGDASQWIIPGGMFAAYHPSGFNTVLVPDHPILAGVPSPLFGNSASHANFYNMPPGVQVLTVDDVFGATLVRYTIGLGEVVASTQTLEFGYAAAQDPGLILANMIPYDYRPTPPWLDAQPRAGSLPPGGSTDVTVTMNAAGLFGGDYEGAVVVNSNDPDEARLDVPVHLHVTGAPDLAIRPRPVTIESAVDFTTSGAMTSHHLATPGAPQGRGRLELGIAGDFSDSLDFSIASLAVEGVALGQLGPLTVACGAGQGTFDISDSTLAGWTADGVVDAVVQNSPAVDPICPVNRHTLRLTYPTAVTAIDFGSLFVGSCRPETLRIGNAGTDLLTVQLLGNLPEYAIQPAALSLPPGALDTVVVTFCPSGIAVFDATLTLQTNDPDESLVTIALHGAGVPPPDIEVAPTKVSADLFTGQSAVRTLTVRNTGGSDLVFAAATANPPTAPLGMRPLAKGQADTRRGPPVLLGHGGPDAFGHRWVDSDEPGGPAFDWVELAGVGTALPYWGDDWNYGPIPIGFDFPYYDQRFDTFNVCSNGWISFTSFSGQFSSVPLPSPFAPENMLAMLWGDLYTDPDEVLYHNDGTRLIVEYRNVTFLGGGIPMTFEILLYPDGRIVYQYLDLGGSMPFATTGFQNGDRTDGLTIAFQAQYLHPGLAIQIQAAPSWLSVTPATGVIPPGGSVDLEARFDAHGLIGGDYEGVIAIASNDPDEPTTSVNAQLHVTGAPDIELGSVAVELDFSADFSGSGAVSLHTFATPSPPEDGGQIEFTVQGDYSDSSATALLSFDGNLVALLGRFFPACASQTGFFGLGQADLAAFMADGEIHVEVRNSPSVDATCPVNRHTVKLRYRAPASSLDFGPVLAGGCAAESLQVRNTGTDVLNVDFVSSQTEFSVTPPSLSLPSGATASVMVHFCPLGLGAFDGTLTLNTNDPDEPEIAIALHGTGTPPPDVEVSPLTLAADLYSGQSTSRSVFVRNTGAGVLAFEIDTRRALGDVLERATAVTPSPRQRLAAARTPATPAAVASSLRSDRVPQGYAAARPPSRTAAGAPVLLIEDAYPWGVASNENVLSINGISYVVIPTSQIAATDLSAYRLVIVASDQYTSSYVTLQERHDQFTAYVEGGGVLEFHAAGWGYQGGDASLVTIPGGTSIRQYYSTLNDVLEPNHPIMRGVPDPFFGNSASHSYFGDVPAGARVLTNDDQGRPTLVAYTLGHGEVIASGQVLEFGWAYGLDAGIILSNLIPFAYRKGPSWLTASPRTGTLPPDGVAEIRVGIDASGVPAGDHHALLVVLSNDPDEAETPVSVDLHVTGAPDLVLPGGFVEIISAMDFFTSGAATLHDLVLPAPPDGPGVILLQIEGDFGDSLSSASLSVEGQTVGDLHGFFTCGSNAVLFPITPGDLASWAADGVIHATVQNTPSVDPICFINRHTMVLQYPGAVTALHFNPMFAGACESESLRVGNAGTEDLAVTFTSSRPEFVAPPPLVLGPGASGGVNVSFCPTTPGTFEGTLTLHTNDPDEAEVVVALDGTALPAPDIALSATQINQDLVVGETGSKTLRIANHGDGPLFVHLGLRVPSLAAPPPPAVSRRPVTEAMRAQHAAARQRYAPAGSPLPSALVAPPTPVAPTTNPTPRTQAVPIFFDDMEHGTAGWTHRATGLDSLAGGVDLWAQSQIRASSGSTSWRVMQHDFQGADALESPPIDLGGVNDALLTFMHWYQFDDCSGTPDFEPDGGVVEVSASGGPWIQIHPRSGYPYLLDDVCGNPLAYRLAYSHNNGLGFFQPDTFDLSGFVGQTIRLRFQAGWDCGNCALNEGWYIDDVSVFAPTPPWVTVAPHDLVVPPLGVGEATLAFDAGELAGGLYDAVLEVSSNDPDESFLAVPVSLVVADVAATVEVLPETVNLHPLLKVMTADIESPPGHGPADIVRDSTRFNRDAAPDPNFAQIADHDADGISELRLKFPRAAAVATLAEGDPTPVVITGLYTDGLRFLARDQLRVVRPRFVSPDPGQHVTPGEPLLVQWSVPDGWTPRATDVFFSRDDGVSWEPIGTGVAGASFTWTPPEIEAPAARVRVALFDEAGLIAFATSGAFRIGRATTTIEEPLAGGTRLLLQNAPNPFHSGVATSIGFRLPTAGSAKLRIYNIAGQLVRVLVDGWLPPGDHLARWDGRDRNGRAVGSGIYFYRLEAGGWHDSRRMTLLN